MFAQRLITIVSRRYMSTVADLYKGLVNGDRGSLARSITLVESTHVEKQQKAKELLAMVLQGLKQRQEKQPSTPISFRIGLILKKQKLDFCFVKYIMKFFFIGLSGSPGAGKWYNFTYF